MKKVRTVRVRIYDERDGECTADYVFPWETLKKFPMETRLPEATARMVIDTYVVEGVAIDIYTVEGRAEPASIDAVRRPEK